MIIKKKFQFDAAHMLSQYEGKCANLHGHTYTGEVIIDARAEPDTGMVIDYNLIKMVVDKFDHAVIFSDATIRNQAEMELFNFVNRYNMRYEVIPGAKCTAENISRYMAEMLAGMLNRKCEVTVILKETPSASAIWTLRRK